MPNRVVPPNWLDHAECVSLASSPTHQRGRRPARRPAPSPSMGMAAAIHLPLLYGTPSPRLDMQLRRVSCPSTKDLGKDGAAPSRSGLSLGSPSGTTAPPPSFSRQAAADCSLLPFLSPSRKQRWQVRCSRFVGKQSR